MMTSSQKSNATTQPLGYAVTASVAAGAMSIGVLVLAGQLTHDPNASAVIPFGWHRVVAIHALAALGLAWSVSRWAVVKWNVVGREAALWSAAGGLAIAGFSVVLAGPVGHLTAVVEPGQTARLALRVVWCVLLEMPWYLASLAMWGQPREARPGRQNLHLLVLTGFVAIALPLCFLALFFPQQTQLAVAKWREGRYVQAQAIVQRLWEAGSHLSLGERPGPEGQHSPQRVVTPRIALVELGQAVAFVSTQLNQLLSQPPTDDSRLQIATLYVALDRMSDAEAVLVPVASRVPAAAILLAQLQQEQKRYEESCKYADQALELTRRADGGGSSVQTQADAIRLQAYFLLALAAGQRSDFPAAERYLLTALEELPAHRAEIHVRLARHYEFLGRLREFQWHQRTAAQLAPERFAPPETLLMKMLSTGAPIGLARPQSSTYHVTDD